ncbi:mCG50629, isoform CRA_a [Mus musculus]|nr:mCG50629, isoform CRA_a [Mus musculus]
MNPKAGGEEEDCVDSGAETGGSDYSHLSSTSSTEDTQKGPQVQQSTSLL